MSRNGPPKGVLFEVCNLPQGAYYVKGQDVIRHDRKTGQKTVCYVLKRPNPTHEVHLTATLNPATGKCDVFAHSRRDMAAARQEKEMQKARQALADIREYNARYNRFA